MEGFPYVYRETVRFRDVDAMGHVNNAVFNTFMETARIAWLMDAGAIDGLGGLSMIVARTEVDFRSPVGYRDTVEIGARVSRFGTKSFDMEFNFEVDGRLVAEGKTVCVAYDYEKGVTVPIPDRWRQRLAA